MGVIVVGLVRVQRICYGRNIALGAAKASLQFCDISFNAGYITLDCGDFSVD